MTHTPGPWELIELGYGISVGNVAWIGFGTAHSREEHAANARLIAAAPELLKELKAIVAGIEPALDEPQVLDKAKAAIAKAEGATS